VKNKGCNLEKNAGKRRGNGAYGIKLPQKWFCS